jgi:flagellar basal body-associated protein FliL
MIYLLLTVVIVLLAYIAFFTPERREQREVRRAQKMFNTPLYPKAVEFMTNDQRNKFHPDEVVKLGFVYTTRKEAMKKLIETRKEYPDLSEEDVQKIVTMRIMTGTRPD